MSFTHINQNPNHFLSFDKDKRDEEHKREVNHTRSRVSRPHDDDDHEPSSCASRFVYIDKTLN